MDRRMPAPSREPTDRPFIVVNGRVLSPAAYRPSTLVDLEDTPAWWSSLALLGVLLIAAGALAGDGRGEAVAVGAVALFLTTAVLAGYERTELATATGSSGVIWSALGISTVLGTDPSLLGTFLGFALGGSLALAAGLLGVARLRRSADSPQ